MSAIQSNPQLAKSAALATLVKVTGSYIRLPGARMLITSAGTTISSVSGGCLEEDLIEKAREIIKLGKPALLPFSTMRSETPDGEAIRGCGGEVEILVEPLQKSRFEVLTDCLSRNGRDKGMCAMATIFKVDGKTEARVGDRLIVRGEKIMSSDVCDKPLAEAIYLDAQAVAESGRSLTKTYTQNDSEIEVFIEPLRAPTSVLIVGAGEITMSLAAFTHELGWRTTVVDHRPGMATREQFPHSTCFTVTAPSDLSAKLSLDEHDAAVILTHICEADLEYLRTLVASSVEYIGLLGSRGRVGGLIGMLSSQEPALNGEALRRVHGPVGLDLGADDPAGIALSIVAEIQAVLAGRSARSLKAGSDRTRSEV